VAIDRPLTLRIDAPASPNPTPTEIRETT